MGAGESQPVETSTAEIRMSADGIVRVVYREGTKVGLAEAVENVEAEATLLVDGPVPTFVDIRGSVAVDRAARDFFSGSRTAEVQTAVALLVGSPVTRMIGNFFLGLNKPVFPIRVFDSEAKALGWLRGFLP